MNFGRGFPAPRPGGTESCIPATPQKPIPVENGIGQNSDEWNPVISRNLFSQGNGVDYSTKSTPNPERIVPQGDGIVQNNDEWNLIRNLFSQGNGIDYSTNSWTPLTPEKSIPQRSNMIPVDIQESQTGNEDWQELIGLYTDMLKEDKPVLDVAQDSNPNPNPNPNPKPVTQKVQKLRNRNSVVGKAKKNVNRSSFQKNDSEEASDSISFFPKNDPANWNSDLLTALVGPKKSSTCVSSKKKLPADRFSDLYRPCYNQNSPPRSEPDAAASNFYRPSFTAIAPDNQSKNIANQRASEKVSFSTDETSTPADQMAPMRNEDEKNQYNELLQTIGDSSSSVISPTRKEHEEGDEQGIDLNKTPMPKTPARRKNTARG